MSKNPYPCKNLLDIHRLYYLNARYYDPTVRRFLNADRPAFMGGWDAVSYNMYAYCSNDPVNCVDPSGCLSEWAKAGLIIGSSVLFVGAVSVLIVYNKHPYLRHGKCSGSDADI